MTKSAYKDAGVDIDEAARLVDKIKPHVNKTVRPGVMSGIGGFGALFDLKPLNYNDPILVSSTDGVGTKLKVAIDVGIHDHVGVDLVAMCVNDLIVQGAEPLFFLDYFATGKLDVDQAEAVIAGIARGCEEAGCALTGGETAEMPGMYAGGDYDLAGFSVGIVERDSIITGETIKEGDIILGLASSGVHSNGFSLVRKLINSAPDYNYESRLSFSDKTLGEELLTPTRIYARPVMEALKIKDPSGNPAIKGMAHITGGGLIENIPRILPDGLGARLNAESWTFPPLFHWLLSAGNIEPHDMARTLNCGIGYVIICADEDKAALKSALEKAGESVFEIGGIKKQENSVPEVEISGMDEAWLRTK